MLPLIVPQETIYPVGDLEVSEKLGLSEYPASTE
jgi:hypothetical protein